MYILIFTVLLIYLYIFIRTMERKTTKQFCTHSQFTLLGKYNAKGYS